MMKEIVPVCFNESKNYMIYIENDFRGLKEFIDTDKRYLIVTDDNVSDLYCTEFNKTVFDGKADVHVFKAGENSKNFQTVLDCYTELINKEHDRSSVLVALGGGVVGDLCGFAASTFMRGIEYIQVPTTLLAMVDSSSGGKTGYNFYGTKNIIGSFHQPNLVYINLSCIKTLPDKEFSLGVAECIKHGLIRDKKYYLFIENQRSDLKKLDEEMLLHLVKRSCEIKAGIVTEDEKETGLRELLNFGHTVGHAVEAASDYCISHGEAVSIGINAALNISFLQKKDSDSVRSLLQFFSLPIKYRGDKKVILKYIMSDKKFRNGIISFIILDNIGEARKIILEDQDTLSGIIDTILEN